MSRPIITVGPRVFVIKLDEEKLHPSLGERWKPDVRNIGGEPIDGVENDSIIRVTFENDGTSDAEIEAELRTIIDHWRANGWLLASEKDQKGS